MHYSTYVPSGLPFSWNSCPLFARQLAATLSLDQLGAACCSSCPDRHIVKVDNALYKHSSIVFALPSYLLPASISKPSKFSEHGIANSAEPLWNARYRLAARKLVRSRDNRITYFVHELYRCRWVHIRVVDSLSTKTSKWIVDSKPQYEKKETYPFGRLYRRSIQLRSQFCSRSGRILQRLHKDGGHVHFFLG